MMINKANYSLVTCFWGKYELHVLASKGKNNWKKLNSTIHLFGDFDQSRNPKFFASKWENNWSYPSRGIYFLYDFDHTTNYVSLRWNEKIVEETLLVLFICHVSTIWVATPITCVEVDNNGRDPCKRIH